jgi:hypothetical protein
MLKLELRDELPLDLARRAMKLDPPGDHEVGRVGKLPNETTAPVTGAAPSPMSDVGAKSGSKTSGCLAEVDNERAWDPFTTKNRLGNRGIATLVLPARAPK